MGLDRRTFLQASLLGGAALAAPRLSFAAAGQTPADTVVVLFLRGGMDPLQAVPPCGDADYYRLRPNIAVPRPGQSGGALDLDGFYGLHPALAPIEPLYRSGALALVHATGLRHDDRSHFECQDHIELALMGLDGHIHAGAASGWLNRQVEHADPADAFYAVGIGSALQKALYGPAPAIAMSSIAGYAFGSRSSRKSELEDLLYAMNGAQTRLANSGRMALDSVDMLAAYAPAGFAVQNAAAYPATLFGAQLAEVAQLIKCGIGLRLACVDLGGWDHHANIQALMPPLLDELARGLLAFHTDLGGLMNDVCVVAMTEFGRRVAENASGGADHGCGSAMLLMGGGVSGGRVFADWPGLGATQLFNGDLEPTVDYRTVLAELMFKRMGNADAGRLFPDAPLSTALGCFRKQRLVTDGCLCLPLA